MLRNKKVKQINSIEKKWEKTKEAIVKAVEKIVGQNRRKIRKPRITTDIIIQNIDERRKFKVLKTDEGRRKYKELRNGIIRGKTKVDRKQM